MTNKASENDLNLFREMLRIRIVEEEIANKYHEKEIRCPVHLSTGQEAPAVGICSHLNKKDKVLSAHRSHAHYLAKGGDLTKMIAELYGKVTGCARGKGGSMHLFDLEAGLIGAVPIVGSTLPIGVGAAWGMKRLGQENLVVIFFGDGATEEGVFSESLDFACLKNLPVLFVCENNQYSVYTPLFKRQSPKRSVIEIAKGHGVEGCLGDGNDVRDVYNKAYTAIKHIRGKKAPYLLELSTYRWREHCGPNWDDDLGYRKEGELQYWMHRCPIERMEKIILENKLQSHENLNQIRTIIRKEVEEAFSSAISSKFPVEEELFEHVYAN